MAFTCAFFSSQHVIATPVASRPRSVTEPLGSASAMKGWKGCTVTSAPGATRASSLTACPATSALPSGMWSSASWLIGHSSSWTGLILSKSRESLAHTSRHSTHWRKSSLKLKLSSLKIQQLSPWRTLGISLRKQSEYSCSYMDKSVWEGVGVPSNWDLPEWLMFPCWAGGTLVWLLWLGGGAVAPGAPCHAQHWQWVPILGAETWPGQAGAVQLPAVLGWGCPAPIALQAANYQGATHACLVLPQGKGQTLLLCERMKRGRD